MSLKPRQGVFIRRTIAESSTMRTRVRRLADALKSEPDMEVVGLASDPSLAQELIVAHKITDQLKHRIRALRTGLRVRLARLRPRHTRPLPPPVSLSHANGLILMGSIDRWDAGDRNDFHAAARRHAADPDRAAHAGALHA